ncbi:MAG: leucyl aminopeptidase [Planctomycetaceae bacterium]
MIKKISDREDFSGKVAELYQHPDPAGLAASRLCLVGLGSAEKLTGEIFRKAMRTLIRNLSRKEGLDLAIIIEPDLIADLCPEYASEIIAEAVEVGTRGQDLYREKPKRHPLESLTILSENDDLAAAADRGTILGAAINITRDVVNSPPNAIYPISFAELAQELASDYDLPCTVLDEDQLADERMGSMLAVGTGSDNPARLVVIEYRGGSETDPVLALVGKGVTFDSGGLSLKPSDSMKEMKMDMAGAGTVLGAMMAISKLELPVNVTGYMGLVENMVSGSSYKLGDVLTARNGVTIEVLNTDAEGRLVLADVLTYAVDQGAEKLIDLATLTGACMVALGTEITGLFSNNGDWADAVKEAAETANELVWEMPMHDFFGDQLKSEVSEIKNIGPRWGGSITAAKFLEHFVDGKPWVHLDIAGPAFMESEKPDRDGGATGAMVRTLVEVARKFKE